ncbi:MAG TPA: phage baseplate assembly protein V [Candidatus Bilophila faecipullorum]|uniref:Phage baseplate assembly protein V n=1 Tax=Candidatus Bilophila faecipullorum TaxID=2838482 RepID=A0A9D1U9K1_9BACT|nr:phage baseplate assembly protein V [Candidatus Bilophila faecipullorum]
MERILSDCISQLARVGFVTARQPERHRVRVQFRDTVTSPLVSGWLPVLTPRASADMAFDLPDVGDQVLCLFLGNGLEDGFVLGSMYGAQTPPVASGDKFHRTFSDGTTIEYDRKAHKLTASVKGDVEANVTGNIEVRLQGNGKVEAVGALDMTSAAKIGLNTPALTMGGAKGGGTNAETQGNIRHRGNIHVTEGDVTVNGISFLGHVHDCPHGGITGAPQ